MTGYQPKLFQEEWDRIQAAGAWKQLPPYKAQRTESRAPARSFVDEILDDLTEPETVDDADPFLDWHQLFTEETPDEEWLFDGVFAIDRGHALYAEHKQGKSLFVLWVCAQMATSRSDVDLIYLDYEMTRADVRERMEDMGYGDDTDLSRFHYDLLPNLPPLDTGEGMAAVLRLVDKVQRPNCHVFVVVDTTSRAAQGKENDADTYIAFYRWTGIALKRRGVTWARLDHAGKDPTKGQRGSSGKGDDVDVIWKLIAGDDGITLHRDAARMLWVDEKVVFNKLADPLRYERGLGMCPAGTKELMAQLDKLGVPVDAGRPKVRKALKAAGVTTSNTVLSAAIKWRRVELQDLSDLTADSKKVKSPNSNRDSAGQHPQTPTSEGTQLSTDSSGQVAAAAGPVSVSLDTDRSSGLLEAAFGPLTDVDPDDYARSLNPGELGDYEPEF